MNKSKYFAELVLRYLEINDEIDKLAARLRNTIRKVRRELEIKKGLYFDEIDEKINNIESVQKVSELLRKELKVGKFEYTSTRMLYYDDTYVPYVLFKISVDDLHDFEIMIRKLEEYKKLLEKQIKIAIKDLKGLLE